MRKALLICLLGVLCVGPSLAQECPESGAIVDWSADSYETRIQTIGGDIEASVSIVGDLTSVVLEDAQDRFEFQVTQVERDVLEVYLDFGIWGSLRYLSPETGDPEVTENLLVDCAGLTQTSLYLALVDARDLILAGVIQLETKPDIVSWAIDSLVRGLDLAQQCPIRPNDFSITCKFPVVGPGDSCPNGDVCPETKKTFFGFDLGFEQKVVFCICNLECEVTVSFGSD